MPRTPKTSPPRSASRPHGTGASAKSPVAGSAAGSGKKSEAADRGSARTTVRASAAAPRPATTATASPRHPEGGILRSTMTTRSQTTLPRGVRQVLGLKPGAQIGYMITGDRVELINPAAVEHEDPVVQQFLQVLGRHMLEQPTEAVVPFPPDLLARARAAAADGPADHDEPLDGAVLL